MVGFLTDGPPLEPDPARRLNLADALLAPDGLRPLVANWREVALHFVRGVQADAIHDGTAETAALLERLLGYPDVPGVAALPSAEGEGEPVLAMRVVKGGTTLNLFTTIATLGTPQDVAAQEVRVECFFPADEATADVFREWAAVG
jgi:hypothetical protein